MSQPSASEPRDDPTTSHKETGLVAPVGFVLPVDQRDVIRTYMDLGHIPHAIARRTGVPVVRVRELVSRYQTYEDTLGMERARGSSFHNRLCTRSGKFSQMCLPCMEPLHERAHRLFCREGVTSVSQLARRLHCTPQQAELVCRPFEDPVRGLYLTQKGSRHLCKDTCDEIYNDHIMRGRSVSCLADEHAVSAAKIRAIIRRYKQSVS